MKQHVVKFLQFLEAKEGKTAPFRVKLLNHELFSFSKDELDVKGSLDLSFTNITTVPKGLRVSGNLYLSGCTSLKSLPDGLQVDGDLFLNGCTSLTSLPNGLRVGISLTLKNTPVAEIQGAYGIWVMIDASGGYVKRAIYV